MKRITKVIRKILNEIIEQSHIEGN